jgi:hypothetical protein
VQAYNAVDADSQIVAQALSDRLTDVALLGELVRQIKNEHRSAGRSVVRRRGYCEANQNSHAGFPSDQGSAPSDNSRYAD